MAEVKDILNSIFKELENRRLGKALTMLENFLYTYPHAYKSDAVAGIRADYQLLVDYWCKNSHDPQRKAIYDQLLRRAFVVTQNVGIHYRIRNTAMMHTMYERARKNHNDWSVSELRQEMEEFVSNVTLLELEPEASREAKGTVLYEQHMLLLRDLFDYIWTARTWNESLAEAFLDILLSPTIDSNDQQTIVSAVMLSAMNAFDANKLSLLLHVYQQSADEAVRQRALVGWVFCLNENGLNLYPEVAELLEQTVAEERCQQELTELQLQLIYCANAEGDRQTIQNEIMPEIMKSSDFRVTGHGIEAVEEDPMEDVLDPDASERRMENVENAMRKIMDMQKQGSDIYFGGFSQMKRFPFFDDICNWFVPFDMNHPVVRRNMKQVRWSGFLRQMLNNNSFCDSDKYSLVFCFNQIMGVMPDKVKQMMDRGEEKFMVEELNMITPETESPAFVRRKYLQSLYRFFKVYPSRSMFRNPFEEKQRLMPGYLFFAEKSLAATALGSQCCEVARFLMKRKRMKEASVLLDNFVETQRDDYQYIVTKAHALRLIGEKSYYGFASVLYKKALEMKADDEHVISGLARSLFATQDYEKSYELYEQLLEKHPEKKSFMLNSAACLVNMKRYEEALKKLYQLNYNHPEDLNVKRVLAWALVGAKRYEQASKLYGELLEIEQPKTDDMLNYGFCLWCSGDVANAANMFHHYEELTGGTSDQLETIINEEERELLLEHGITETEILLMLDQL